MKKENPTFMIVAGEASGDAHAAKLVRELRAITPTSEFFGSTGPKMRNEGVEAVVRSDELSIVGLLEIGKALPMFINAFRRLKAAAIERRPDAVILVDFPDFNMKLAKSLKKQGLIIVYYISPQLWAWRKYRLRTVRKYVDLVISILPFEKDWYAEHGIHHVEYVGSPLAREVHADVTKEDFCAKHGLDPALPIVALLPGSRHAEISRILPILIETAELMQRGNRDLQFVVALPSSETAKRVTGKMKRGIGDGITLVEGETYDALNASDAAAVTSGTATLEAGIIGTPMAIVYKTSAINYTLLRPMIDVEHFGLINLIAGERVARELIQSDFTAQALSAELFTILEPEENANIRERLRIAADKLGHGGASKRAAEATLKLLKTR